MGLCPVWALDPSQQASCLRAECPDFRLLDPLLLGFDIVCMFVRRDGVHQAGLKLRWRGGCEYECGQPSARVIAVRDGGC